MSIEQVLQRIERQGGTNRDELVALIECARALEMLLQYIDDHDWGHIPEGETGDVARAALAKLAELGK